MSTDDAHQSSELSGKRVAFVGKLGGVTRREAQRLVREHGGVPLGRCDSTAHLIVIGADVLSLDDEEALLDGPVRQAADEGRIEIISETQFWQRLGLMEDEPCEPRLYTPAMLAELLGVSVATIRRWHRRGLIKPVKEIHRLPYFDFQEVATARRIAQLLAEGTQPHIIERKLAQLSRYLPNVDRPLAQLSVIVEGKQILLRHGEGLIEPGGQLRIDFSAFESPDRTAPAAPTLSLADHLAEQQQFATPQDMLRAAAAHEEQGELPEAVEMCRAALAVGGRTRKSAFNWLNCCTGSGMFRRARAILHGHRTGRRLRRGTG